MYIGSGLERGLCPSLSVFRAGHASLVKSDIATRYRPYLGGLLPFSSLAGMVFLLPFLNFLLLFRCFLL